MKLAAAERVVELRRQQALQLFLRLAVDRFRGRCATRLLNQRGFDNWSQECTFREAGSDHARPIRMNIIDHKGVAGGFALGMIFTQMLVAGRKLIMAMRQYFRVM